MSLCKDSFRHQISGPFVLNMKIVFQLLQEANKSKNGKASHSQWCNYDDLNEYFWLVWI